MATLPRPSRTDEPSRIVLREVPWSAYRALRDTPANRHLRMTYLDGTLELLSPEYIHERGAGRLGMVVRAVARAFGVTYQGAGSTTLRRRRPKPLRGQAREADASFYFGANAEHVASRDTIDLAVDPPPDLAIEVDHTAPSRWRLSVYARLRVPEVWRYDVDAGTLWFGKLTDAGSYVSIERSVALPMLTCAGVLDVIHRGEGLTDSRFETLLDGWVRDELVPRAEGEDEGGER